MMSSMTATDYQWSLCNPGPETLLVWLEPWCEEFEVPVRSTITMKPSGDAHEPALGEVEWGPDNLVIWATGPTVAVFIDNVLQDSGSAEIPIPDGLTKQMLNIAFAGQPAARLGGTPFNPVRRTSLWWRVKGLIGL